MFDLDSRWDEVRVGHMLPEENEGIASALDVSGGLLGSVSH